ncbi:MAG: gamma-glutamyltransferase, partial [Dongiaceae bacterium]
MKRRDFLGCAGAAAAAGPLAFSQQIGDLVRLDRPELAGRAHRAVMGRNGVVATADQHGSLAGIRMLMKGGNAIDAIVAAAAALNVVEPYMSGIGGFGGFMLLYIARDRQVRALDMMGASPAAARIEKFTERDCDEGYLAPIVPGSLLGWATALDRYGTMSLADVFEPAIELAEGGFAVTQYDALSFAATAEKLSKFPTTARIFLPDGKPPRAGQVLKQKALARSFRRIALDGPD